MKYAEGSAKVTEYRRQIASIRQQMRETQAAVEPQDVEDYEFQTTRGPVRLSQLFGDREDLIVIHNMGTSCPNCTMWADGYNGIHHHVASRAAFVVSSPDAPETQRQFAAGRGWTFPMVSHAGTTFAADMGYRSEKGGWLPGISVFQRRGAKIVRVSDTRFSPGDDFCVVWHMFDMLPGGAGDWMPKKQYT
jgi:predicted dithiol-disulfide oxidoreductase (DUF899 family)